MSKLMTLEEINSRLSKHNFGLLSNYCGLYKKYEFICPGCNSRFIARLSDILDNRIGSCGCLRGRKRRRGTTYIPKEYFSVVKKHAEARGYSFDITIEFMEELLVKQNFTCKLSGLPIELKYSGIRKACNTASLDRIDNDKGYTTDNVQWVHKDINWMKQDFKQEYFLELCKLITCNQSNEH
jgi:hypothetical protein